MNITHVIESLDPAGGGPPQVAARLASAQAKAGHKVVLVSFHSPGRVNEVSKSLASVPYLEQVEFFYLQPPANLIQQLSAHHIRAKLETVINRSDVLHLHGLWDPLLRAAGFVARKLNKPYAVCPHGMLDPWSMSQKSRKKRLAMTLLYNKIINRALFIHALNDDESQLLTPRGFTSPVIVSPNGVFLEEIEPLPVPGSFRKLHPELGDKPYILFLARLHYKKGLDYLAAGYQMLVQAGSDAHLVVAGPDEGARQEFKEQLEALGLLDRVHCVGPIYGKTKYAALNDAACFCLPSRQEGFSVAITEALACGVPCIISEPCHFPQVGESEAGRVVSLDARKIGEALIEVMASEPLRQHMGENGRNLVRHHYTWPAIAEHLVAHYQNYMA